MIFQSDDVGAKTLGTMKVQGGKGLYQFLNGSVFS